MVGATKITELKGIGEKTAARFKSVGIETIADAVQYYPRGYDVYEAPVPVCDLEEGRTFTIRGRVHGRIESRYGKTVQITTARFGDGTGEVKTIWFRMPYVRSTLSAPGDFILRGLIARKGNELVMEQPQIFYPCEKYAEKQNTLQPLYSLVKGISNNAVIRLVRQALDLIDLPADPLPEELRARYQLADYEFALRNIHFPGTKEDYYLARRRLVFQEFIEFILGLREMKSAEGTAPNHYPVTRTDDADQLIASLPYRLTDAQLRVWQEIRADLAGPRPMSRLVQGDVGSGKTILALLALVSAAQCGWQGALMAPTEVLARQHYQSVNAMLAQAGLDIRTELLTGTMTAKEKREAYQRVASGEAQLIIGTHAVIQQKVEYRNLALVITDEQHRFGVRQREKFAEKGQYPHVLVMSATPIPRTLAIILYGDLDISVIDELPANRLPIKNCVVGTDYRRTAYSFMAGQVKAGRQCYIICPMIEEAETIEAENVTEYAKTLTAAMPDGIRIDCLHGRMKQDEKDRIMQRFADDETDILVSTTVIEVGIDVPNATVIMIENAERFGLAQLHQLRGRVGRGKYQSYCIFMTAAKSQKIKERLEVLNHSNDGFKIAEEDLKLRGPGDLFGIRQSGLMNFTLADIYQDADILQIAAELADDLKDVVKVREKSAVL